MEYATNNKEYFQYEGDWADDEFHGSGTLYYKDKSSYEGDFSRGQRHGNGTHSILGKDSTTVFRGRYEKNVPKRGKFDYPNGSYYIGDVQNNQRHGQGVIQYPNGDQYNGRFVNGEIDGLGLMNYAEPKDHIYYGYFKQNKKQGEGELRTNDFEYFGNFIKDKRDGLGVIIFKTSPLFVRYDGEFSGNYIHGKGKMLLSNGDMISGNFINPNIDKLNPEANQKFEGEPKIEELDVKDCTIVHKNGDIYKGSLRSGKKFGDSIYTCSREKEEYTFTGPYFDGQRNGKGKIVYKSGEVFEGFFANNDLKNGTFIFANGDTYTGSFVQNQCSGFGMMVYKADILKKSYEGGFSEGQLHGEGTVIKHNGDKFVGTFVKGHQKGEGTLTKKKVTLKGYFTRFVANGKVKVWHREEKTYFIGYMKDGVRDTAPEAEPPSELWIDCFNNPSDAQLTFKPKFKKYKGEFKEGKCNGKATIEYPNGNIYTGECIDAEPDGKGEMIFAPNGDIYNGQWEKGFMASGKGIYTFSERNPEFESYCGDFKENKFNGNGKLTYRNKTVYIGQFYLGLRHGMGRESTPDPRNPSVMKEVYQGMFVNGVKQGENSIKIDKKKLSLTNSNSVDL
jgi:hypothetical protein